MPAVCADKHLLSKVLGLQSVGGRGTADGVAAIIALDLPTYLSLFSVTAILAPLLEEIVFRGFLLTTLTRWLPTPVAIVVRACFARWPPCALLGNCQEHSHNPAAAQASATAFGCAHLSLRDLPQLIALGCLLGVTYTRSRNLLTPMLIHGAWNGTVLTVLYVLISNGIDVQKLLAT